MDELTEKIQQPTSRKDNVMENKSRNLTAYAAVIGAYMATSPLCQASVASQHEHGISKAAQEQIRSKVNNQQFAQRSNDKHCEAVGPHCRGR